MVALLILAKWAAQLWLERLNARHVLAHAGAVPEAFKGVVDEATYAKSVQYTLAKGRLDQVEMTYNSVVLLLVLFSGVLPWGFQAFTQGWAVRLGRWRPSCLSRAWRCRCRVCRWIGMTSSAWKSASASTPRRRSSGGWTGSKGCCWRSCWAIRCWCWC